MECDQPQTGPSGPQVLLPSIDGKTQVDEGQHSPGHGRYPRLVNEEPHFEVVIHYSSSYVWVGSCTQTGNAGHHTVKYFFATLQY